MRGPASARGVALEVLDRVLGDARPLDETFAGNPDLARLASRDRAFARLLVTMTLRRLGQIDALLDGFLRSRPKAIRVRNLLRLGVAQLLFLETPAHAAVAETHLRRVCSMPCCAGPRARAKSCSPVRTQRA
jgi:16S rRNA (cytosine967-C5)-methyltransferase